MPFKAVRKLRAKVDPIASALPQTLQQDGPAAAAAHVYNALDGDLDNTDRFQLYQHTVSFFLRNGEVNRAALLYARMVREGYLPSFSLRTQMRVIKVVESLPPEQHEHALLPVITQYIEDPSFDDDALTDQELDVICGVYRILNSK